MEALWQDTRYGLRLVLKTPGFTALAILILALGIGVNTAIFGLVNTVLLRPLLIEDPHQIVGLYSKNTQRPDSYRGFSYPLYVDIRERNTVFSSLAAHDLSIVGFTDGDTTRRAFVEFVSSNYFSTFGVRLLRGREFTPEEERPGSAVPVAIVSHGYWNKQGRDPELVGKIVRINTRPFTIIGIAPEGFTGTMAMLSAEAWLPLGMYEASGTDLDGERRSLTDRGYNRLFVVGRLDSGLSPADADTRLGILAAQLEKDFPKFNQDQTFIAHPRSRLGLSTNPTDPFQVSVIFILLSAMAGVVLLIACLNLANMMLARGTARRKEIAIRLALGGGRRRVVRQLLTEGLVLSLAGGLAGLLLAYWGLRLLVGSFEAVIPFGIVMNFDPDARVLVTTLGFCVLSTLIFGFGPAWRSSRPDVAVDLKSNESGFLSGAGKRRFVSTRNFLVVGQLSLSLALLAAGGLFIQGALEAARLDPGFRLDDGVLVELDAGLIGYDELRARGTYAELEERLRTLPGVEYASLAATVPFGNIRLGERVRRAGEPATDGSEDRSVSSGFNAIGADYFRTLDVPLLRGRAFSPAEAVDASASPVAIIDEELAARLFPGEDPLGRQIQYGREDTENGRRRFEVVGIAPNLRQSLLFASRESNIYVPFGQEFRYNVHIHLRTSAGDDRGLTSLLQTVRREIRSTDDRIPILTLRTFRDHFDASSELWLVRTGAKLFSLFGALALFLAAAGVYGVRAFTVAQRTREIGIRMALGATPRDALGLVMREGLTLTLWGSGIGLAIAFLVGQLLSGMLYQVSATDPAVFAGAATVLASFSLLACYVPAHRASTVTPMTALRYE